MKRSRSDVKLTLRMSRGLRPMSHPGHPVYIKAYVFALVEAYEAFQLLLTTGV